MLLLLKYRNTYSSCLFIFPTVYALQTKNPFYDVALGSSICLCTSVTNHYLQARQKTVQTIDRVVVLFMAAFFTCDCIYTLGFQFYCLCVYTFGLAALAWYAYLHTQPREMYEKYHCGVHVLANTGIMFYIKARDIGL
jgi:hypothetical protein